jgi:hypothetical protein
LGTIETEKKAANTHQNITGDEEASNYKKEWALYSLHAVRWFSAIKELNSGFKLESKERKKRRKRRITKKKELYFEFLLKLDL